MPAYDLIGDIHGHADELQALLAHLGYRPHAGAFRHPDYPRRLAVFVGDFLDRGPKILATLQLVRPMIESGSALAVLGNHEWNAFAFHTADPDAPGEALRRRTPKNIQQHQATLDQVPPRELASHLDFLRRLPVALDLGDLRVVHACWDDVAFGVIQEALLRHGCQAGLTDAFLVEGSNEESLLFAALEIVLKGKEMDLPPGVSFHDKDGHERFVSRVRWYAPPAGHTVASYALPHFDGIPDVKLPAKVLAEARPYAPANPPVFFGHYWLTDSQPRALAENVACLDYSVARGGFLCGYRWGGEGSVDADRFVRVD